MIASLLLTVVCSLTTATQDDPLEQRFDRSSRDAFNESRKVIIGSLDDADRQRVHIAMLVMASRPGERRPPNRIFGGLTPNKVLAAVGERLGEPMSATLATEMTMYSTVRGDLNTDALQQYVTAMTADDFDRPIHDGSKTVDLYFSQLPFDDEGVGRVFAGELTLLRDILFRKAKEDDPFLTEEEFFEDKTPRDLIKAGREVIGGPVSSGTIREWKIGR